MRRTNPPGVDLSADNELPELLEERELLRRRMADDKARLVAINETLAAKLGDALRGQLPGWEIWRVIAEHRAYRVPEGIWRYIKAKRTHERRLH
jgi:hypothetical protein